MQHRTKWEKKKRKKKRSASSACRSSQTKLRSIPADMPSSAFLVSCEESCRSQSQNHFFWVLITDCSSSWSEISRQCPMCKGPIEQLLSNIHGPNDFQRHFLQPLASTSATALDSAGSRPYTEEAVRAQLNARPTHPRNRHGLYQSRSSRRRSALKSRNELDETDQAELCLLRRKLVYKHNLYAKHMGSNAWSRFRSFTPAQFSSSPELRSRVSRFVRLSSCPCRCPPAQSISIACS